MKALAIIKENEGKIYADETDVQQLLERLYYMKENYDQAVLCLQQAIELQAQTVGQDHRILPKYKQIENMGCRLGAGARDESNATACLKRRTNKRP